MKKSEANAMVDLAQTAKERLEKEQGAIIKTHDDKLSVALVYPNKYEVGMANLGFQKVYHLLNHAGRRSLRTGFFTITRPGRFSEKGTHTSFLHGNVGTT